MSLKKRFFSFELSNHLLLVPEASLSHIRDEINYPNYKLVSPQRKADRI